ncbi:tetratricopeptide (TPR) repeat protein [Granulicella aggregans]|uniref:Tetratricopeptide (TPR) repeat protein n=1 Tax=Granulicella aggregans TaxID=474949 RepID=A0A7W7Z961_9BACT|nr:tetratricopeptide repeat protein [Granulicella aggregans]MBB5055598.1 tetratricopeptide (TPR) repeat protein [Granulicella aggregans]
MSAARLSLRLNLSLSLLLVFFVPLSASPQAKGDEVSPAVERLYAEATQAQQANDTATAIAKYQAMIKLAPHLAAAYNNLGMLYFNDRDYEHAVETLDHGLKLHVSMPTATAMLGLSYYQLGQNAKAEPLIKKALSGKPDDDQLELALAQVQIKQSEYQQAAATLNHFLERNPKDQNGWYLLGKTYLQMSQDALGKINQIDPNSVVAHEITGEIDESMHNYELALVEYKKAIELAPNQPGIHLHVANTYWLMTNWEPAEKEFAAELAIDPNNCSARWKLANSMLELNEPADKALAELNQSVERCPNLMQARVDRARALVRLERQQEALPDLKLALLDNPREPSIHFLLASVYRAAGDQAQAAEETKIYARLQREAREAVAAQAADVVRVKKDAQ